MDGPRPGANCAPLDWKGRTYVLPAVDQDAKRLFHALANAYALAQVRATEPHADSPEGFARDYREAQEMVQTGHYWFDARGGWLFRGTLPGLVRLAWACLSPKYPRLPLAEVEAMAAGDGGAWLAERFRLANENPTGPSPGPGPSGGSSTPDSPSSGDSAAGRSAA